jgi:hypothetical protein
MSEGSLSPLEGVVVEGVLEDREFHEILHTGTFE